MPFYNKGKDDWSPYHSQHYMLAQALVLFLGRVILTPSIPPVIKLLISQTVPFVLTLKKYIPFYDLH